MSQDRSLQSNTEYPKPPQGDGESQDSCEQFRHPEDTTDTCSMTSSRLENEQQPDERSHTVESARQNRRTTCAGKSNPLKKRTRNTKSSKMSDQGSTSKGKAFCEWLTPFSKDTSKKLLSRTGIDCVDSLSTFSNGYAGGGILESWFKTKSYALPNKSSQKILWPSSMCFPASCTEAGDTGTKARKIRLKPLKGQERVLRKWMKSARQTYNEALRLVKAKKAKANLLLSKLVVTSRDTDKNSRLESMKSAPADVRKSATRDLVKNFVSARASYKARLRKVKSGKAKIKKKRKSGQFKGRRRYRRKKPFEVKFKSRRLTSDSIELERKSISFEGNTVSFFKSTEKHRLQVDTSEAFSDEPGVHKPAQSCRIAYCFGRWYIIVPEQVQITEEGTDTSKEPRIIGIDPGLRTAFTCSSNSGDVLEVGINTRFRFQREHAKKTSIADKIRDTTCVKKKTKLRRAWYRCQARAKHLAADLHWKTIKHILDNYDVVVIGKIGVQSLVSKTGQSASNKRMFSYLSHYSFRQRLKYKAGLLNKVVVEQDESYTSQACFRCGHLDKNLGAAKTYVCKECGLVIDRDVNSGFNIMVRCASEHHTAEATVLGKRKS